MSARQILHVCTQMKSALIPPEPAGNQQNLCGGEQRKSVCGEMCQRRSHTSAIGGVRQSCTEVDTRLAIWSKVRYPGVSVYPDRSGDYHAGHIARQLEISAGSRWACQTVVKADHGYRTMQVFDNRCTCRTALDCRAKPLA